MMSEPLLDVRDLHLSFGRRHVLRGMSVSFRRGESVLIAGKNGTGKSTFLRCLAGVLHPDKGTITRSGVVTARKMGFVSESLSLFEDWTLDQGIRFHSQAFGLARFDDSLVRKLNLRSGQKIKELSRGERALFLFSLVLSQQPELLMIDEVIHNMDSYTRELLLEGLVEAIASFKTTVLLVNHTFQDVERLPERVLLMRDGLFSLDAGAESLQAEVKKLVSEGPPPPEIPLIFRREAEYFKEYFIYPFREEMRRALRGDIHDLSLSDILKAFIGGSYAP